MGESIIAYLSAGSNLGDRKINLERGIRALLDGGVSIRHISPVFETEPVGFREQPWFLNIALGVETQLSPDELLSGCLKIEADLGRVRTIAGGPRTLDLDILLYGNLVIDKPGLRVPHPRMALRRFVLAPLACIAPGIVHPELGRNISELLTTCKDPSKVVLHSSLAWP
jgi:2-amino-4-hydroxy-6-hydroxymethyldihydropteridine diphosphokinase